MDIRKNNIVTDPDYSIFSDPAIRLQKTNVEIGYMIIALLMITNMISWVVVPLIGRRFFDNYQSSIKLLQTFSLLLIVAEFVVMFIFSKRISYRIVIGIIGGIVVLFQLYNIFLRLNF